MLALSSQQIAMQSALMQGSLLLAGGSLQQYRGIADTIQGHLDLGVPVSDVVTNITESVERLGETEENPDFATAHMLLRHIVLGGFPEEGRFLEVSLRDTSTFITSTAVRLSGVVEVMPDSLAPLRQAGMTVPPRSRTLGARQRLSTGRMAPISMLPEVGEEKFTSDNRVATIVFTDFVGFTAKTEKLKPEALFAQLNRCFEVLDQQITEHGGRMIKTIGDAVMATFGAPQTHGRDAVNAIRAAIQMQQALEILNVEFARDGLPTFEMRVGVHTGEIAGGGLGGIRQKDYDVIGTAVSAASRTESLKGSDEDERIPKGSRILITERTCQEPEVARTFVVERIAEVAVKGLEEPLIIHKVIRERDPEEIAARDGQHDATFQGRDAEMQQLHDIFEGVESEGARLAVVSGQPGQGKSRLRSEFLRSIVREREADVKIIHTKGLAREAHPQYYYIADALAQAVGIGPNDHQEAIELKIRNMVWFAVRGSEEEQERTAQLIGHLIGASFEVDAESRDELSDEVLSLRRRIHQEMIALMYVPDEYRESINKAVLRLIEGFASKSPVVFSLDDIQWADEDSLGLLHYLIERMQDKPLMMLGLARPRFLEYQDEYFDPEVSINIKLTDLNEKALQAIVRELIEERFDGEDVDDVARMIVEASRGNPYFLHEMARAAQRGWVRKDPDTGAWEFLSASGARVPTTAEGFLQARIDRLDAHERELIEVAAVLADRFDMKTLEALGFKESAVVIEQLVENHVMRLIGHDQYAIRHDMMRETVYKMMRLRRRRTLHRLVAEHYLQLEERNHAVIASHLELGGEPLRAVTHYQKEADRAFKLRLKRAAYSYDKVVSLARNLNIEHAVMGLIGLNRIELERKNYDGATDYIVRAWDLIADTDDINRDVRATLYMQEGMTLQAQNRIKQAIAAIELGLDLFDDGDSSLALFELMLLRGRIECDNNRNFAEATVFMEKALDTAKALDNNSLIATVYSGFAFIVGQYNDYLGILRYSRKADMLLTGSEEYYRIISVKNNIGAVLYYLGQYEDAIASYKEAVLVSEKQYGGRHLGKLLHNIGAVDRMLENHEEAEHAFVKALEIHSQTPNDEFEEGITHVYRALNYLDQQEYESAIASASEALGISEYLDDRKLEALGQMILAKAYILQAQYEDAIKHSKIAYDILMEFRGQDTSIEEFDTEIMLLHSQALRGTNDYYLALQVITKAKGIVADRAQTIKEDKIRSSYLNEVKVNRDIYLLEKTLCYENEKAGSNKALNELCKKSGYVSAGPLSEYASTIAKMSPGRVSQSVPVGDSFISGVVLNAPIVEVMTNILTQEVNLDRNEGPIPNVWAENVRWMPQPLIVGQSASAYVEFDLKTSLPWVSDAILKIAGIGSHIRVRYSDDIIFNEHDIRIAMRLDDSSGTFSSEQFGEIEFILTPLRSGQTVLTMRMQSRPFTKNPQKFIKASVGAARR